MGLLGAILGYKSKRRALRQKRRISRLQRQRLNTIRELTKIKQSQERGQLDDRLFDAGLTASTQGDRLKRQLALQHISELQGLNIAAAEGKFNEIQARAEKRAAQLQIIDSALGFIEGLVALKALQPSRESISSVSSLSPIRMINTDAIVSPVPTGDGTTQNITQDASSSTEIPSSIRGAAGGTILSSPSGASFETGETGPVVGIRGLFRQPTPLPQ